MLNVLLLDTPPILLLVSGQLVPAYEVRRRDWPDVPTGAAVALLDSGQGLEYGPRIVWAGTVIVNHLTAYGRGSLTFAPANPRPDDDPQFSFEAEGLKRLYLLPNGLPPAQPKPAALVAWARRVSSKPATGGTNRPPQPPAGQ